MRYAGQAGPRVHTPDTSSSGATRGQPSVIFTLAGAVTVSTSPKITPRHNATFTGVSLTLGTAGSTSTTLHVYKNGVSIGSVTVAASQTYAYAAFGSPVSLIARTDNYQVGVTAAGTGASDIGGEIEVN
jgi:hypothetical protein